MTGRRTIAAPRRRTAIRLALAAVIVVSLLVLVQGAATTRTPNDSTSIDDATAVAPPRENVTVVATDSNAWLTESSDGPRANSELIAFGPDGEQLYYNDSYDRYWDVDPSPAGRWTVLYVASRHLSGEECHATTVCTRNVIERLNLTTDTTTRLFSRVTPYKHSTRWHDADRIADDRYVVADIYRDEVFVVNTTTGLVDWGWEAQQAYPVGSGGPFPRDWTHLNDVEVLDDGRIMASLRNQDQVVFLDRETGLVENWTLGADNARDVLYEQHNPDFIPAARGGPAVLVADSENNRVVEYQRVGGRWERSWNWSDDRLLWPRDADRLPNGHTLVTDSNGNRVFELDRRGNVVWSVDVAFPYEAERLGTGDESSGGRSAAALGLDSRAASGSHDAAGTTERAGFLTAAWRLVKAVVPDSVLNVVVYVLPAGLTGREVVAALALAGASVSWLAVELRWSSLSLGVRWPVTLRRR